jgi:hypothetical protein
MYFFLSPMARISTKARAEFSTLTVEAANNWHNHCRLTEMYSGEQQ